MPGLIYYLPGRTSLSLDEAREAGLGHAFDEAPQRTDAGAGPGGQGQGILVCRTAQPAGDLLAGIGHYTWRKLAGREVWAGYETARRPGPGDLARPGLLPGIPTELSDGRWWLVPMARAWSQEAGEEDPAWSCKLPRSIDRNAAGRWVYGPVVPRHAAVWEAGCRWLAAKQGGSVTIDAHGGRLEYTYADAVDDAVACLAANYYLGPDEVAMLGLLDDQTAQRILDAAIDWATFWDWFKKKARESARSTPAGSSTGSGGKAGAPPATGPPSPTSPASAPA